MLWVMNEIVEASVNRGISRDDLNVKWINSCKKVRVIEKILTD